MAEDHVDSVSFTIYHNDQGYDFGIRHVTEQGETESTTFDLEDPAASSTFASSLLFYAQALLQDAIMRQFEERVARPLTLPTDPGESP